MATRTFVGTVNGDLNSALNYSELEAPGPGDTIEFDTMGQAEGGGFGEVFLSADLTVTRIWATNFNPVVDLSGFALTVNHLQNGVAVSYTDGTLNLVGGDCAMPIDETGVTLNVSGTVNMTYSDGESVGFTSINIAASAVVAVVAGSVNSLTSTDITIGAGATVNWGAGSIIGCHDLTCAGSMSGGNGWFLDVLGTAVITAGTITNCDATGSAGAPLDATAATDGGGNTGLTFNDEESVLHTLTVTNGTGDGDYDPADVVPIVAAAPPGGSYFNQWTGDVATVADVSDASTTLIMPDADITVVATYVVLPAAATAAPAGGQALGATPASKPDPGGDALGALSLIRVGL